jgi:hypothetical protein
VIGHEHGHFMSGNYSKDNNPGGTHFIGDSHQDLRLSWSEGSRPGSRARPGARSA